MNRCSLAAAALAVLSLLSPPARAGDPFVWTVTTTSGTPETIRVRGDNLIRATDAVILGFGRAAPLYNRDVSATLNYAGVHDALQLTLTGDRTSGTLRYAATHGPTDTFSAAGADPSASAARVVDDQVYSDLTDPHHQQYENLQQVLNRQSYIMPLDGNPSAATAFLADQTFQKYAFDRPGQPPGYSNVGPRYDDEGRPYPAYAGQLYQPVFWYQTEGLAESTNGFDGYDLRFSFNAAGHFAPRVGWSVSVPYQYRNINGAQSETVGVNFGVPVGIVRPGRRNPFAWTVTPFIDLAVNDSRDLGSTQGIFDGGVASKLDVAFGRRRQWTLTYGSQFTGFAGLGPDRQAFYDDGGYGGDYYGGAFRGHLAQQLFKNGLQLTRRFAYGLSADLSVTYNTFVADAATDQWWTPRAEVAWQLSPNFAIRLAYRADLANRYQSQGGDFSIDYKY